MRLITNEGISLANGVQVPQNLFSVFLLRWVLYNAEVQPTKQEFSRSGITA